MKYAILWCLLLSMAVVAQKSASRLPVLYDAATMNLNDREKLMTPQLARRGANVASATRRPWIDANGWRFVRNPSGKFYYDLPAGKAALALAEAYTFNADAVVKIDAADKAEAAKMLAFLQALPQNNLPAVADLNAIDDGSDEMGEVLNLLVRRNLMFRVAPKPDPRTRINVQLGTKEYPREAANNPSDFVLRVRRQLTDEQRSLRIYGSEMVLGRLHSDGQRTRLHLLNYSGREIDSLRVRVRGVSTQISAHVFGFDRQVTQEVAVASGFTEFTLPQLGVYAVIDLAK
jgi:hypothetical protein